MPCSSAFIVNFEQVIAGWVPFPQKHFAESKMTPNSAVLSVFIGTITKNEMVTIIVKHMTF